jgi:hypothetical protein
VSSGSVISRGARRVIIVLVVVVLENAAFFEGRRITSARLLALITVGGLRATGPLEDEDENENDIGTRQGPATA